ncbi:hypothetical protein BP5796_12640 [Coleophoma crateriformis]|uniref:Fe2OG dioxygenase domain-containing protein n=1 Tax=Coleophoma crateriformis TaxID=565419 RepID=A0A3D8Q696_9HELO|nr:hypothetical protein BP5796_12640 [Coleophoma crateriformis]
MTCLSCGLLHKIREFLLTQSSGKNDIPDDKYAESLGAQDSRSPNTIENNRLPTSVPPLLTPSPPFIDVALPRVRRDHQLALAYQGWTPITYDEPSDRLESSAAALLQAGKAFFDQSASYKHVFKTQLGSEEGWSCVEGEKEFLTLRTLDGTPRELRDPAAAFWAEAGGLLNQQLGRIAESLGLPAEKLTMFSEPCKDLGPGKTSTMLRLFKYEGPEGGRPLIVSEPHEDLGLLSLVVGDSPGLEVWSLQHQQWLPIERSYTRPAATLLIGCQLEIFSNHTYRAGGHRVCTYPSPHYNSTLGGSDTPPVTEFELQQKFMGGCRYSIVFVLRAHSSVPINSHELTTHITGPFSNPIQEITAGELLADIQKAHFNVNTKFQERDEQKRHLAKKNGTKV